MPLRAFKTRENPSVTQRLTKREELSFLTVLALPKASSRGLALMIWSSRVPCQGKSSAHIWGLGVSHLTAHTLTWQPDPPAFCLKLVPPSSSPQWLQLLQSTGWHVSCSQSFLPRILRCQTVIKYMWEFKLYDKWNCFLYYPWLANVPVFICLCQSPLGFSLQPVFSSYYFCCFALMKSWDIQSLIMQHLFLECLKCVRLSSMYWGQDLRSPRSN